MDRSEDVAHKTAEKQEMEKVALIIEKELKKLEIQFLNPDERKKIDFDTLINIMKFMAENGCLFEKFFHRHWVVLSELLKYEPQKCVEYIGEITVLMCELIGITDISKKVVNTWLQFWLELLKNVPSDVKCVQFSEPDNKKFENCVNFVIGAECLSSQFKMLNILCTYLDGSMEPRERLWPLFADKLTPVTFEAIKSIAWIKGTIPLARQLDILERINAIPSERLIVSELVEFIKFDDCTTITCERHSGRMYFNKLTKTIEFLLAYKSAPLLIRISARKLKNVKIVDTDFFIEELRLELKKPPHMSTAYGDRIKSSDMNVPGEFIDVIFNTGFRKNQLKSLLLEMFDITPDIFPSHMSSNPDFDSDCEIIAHSIVADESMQINTPSKSLMPVVHSTPKPSEFKSDSNLIQKDLTNGSMGKQSTQISNSSFYGTNRRNKSDTNESKKVETLRRNTRRASAQTARGNIRKSMEESQYDFDENENGEVVYKKRKNSANTNAVQPKKTKRNQKVVEPPKWPVLNIQPKQASAGTREPRKLYPIGNDLFELDADDASKTPKMDEPKTPKMVGTKDVSNAELTPASFHSSILKDPKKMCNRFFENISRINEDQKKHGSFNPNVTYSYRRTMKTEADSTSGNTQQQNQQKKEQMNYADFNRGVLPDDGLDVKHMAQVDINDNSEEDAHMRNRQQIRKDLKAIQVLATQALEQL